MDTPNFDALVRETGALKSQITYLKMSYDMVVVEAKQKEEALRVKSMLLDNKLRTSASDLETEKRSSAEAWGRVLQLEKALQAKSQALTYNEGMVTKLRNELEQKQASWDKAANYRDRVLELVGQCDEKSKRIADLCEENAALEKRINERFTDINYHMNAIDRLSAFVKPNDQTSEGVVSAAINWINRLIEDHEKSQAVIRELASDRDKLRRWKDEQLEINKKWDHIDSMVRAHPEVIIGASIISTIDKWLRERDHLKRQLAEIKSLLP